MSLSFTRMIFPPFLCIMHVIKYCYCIKTSPNPAGVFRTNCYACAARAAHRHSSTCHGLVRILAWLRKLGHDTFELRTDGAPEMVKLASDVQAARLAMPGRHRTIVSQGKGHDSQSMGSVES